MTEDQFIKKCCIALEVEPGELDKESSPDNVPTWDSMGWLSLIAMIDEELGVILENRSLKTVRTLGDIIDLLKIHGVLE